MLPSPDSAFGEAGASQPNGDSAATFYLVRSREGRALSRARYRGAESFLSAIEDGRYRRGPDLLYQAGIVAQLGLSAHLLDVGFDDRWCARYIGLDIGKALAHANASGLGYDAPEFAELAALLSPYNRWRNPDAAGLRAVCPAALPDMPKILRPLLDHVRMVTGHCRPARGTR